MVRRKEKQMKSLDEISRLIKKCRVCRVGMAKNNIPYIVPVSFGYDGKAIYFHTTAKEGMKREYMLANNQVCFEFEHGVEVVSHEQTPCNWSFEFQSVIGFGQVEELQSEEDKIKGLQLIMAQYSAQTWDFSGIPITAVSVYKITIESMTGKQSLNFAEE